ncbi:MAG: septal ring lytic transglycosylase RlpA family protein [Syntrophales bacterium]|nr:septal ring lytic transglycosylase RlpA family protein [Syntrophales bacterium]MCK9391518.1 septal ring lytic transglycosylase RlpA family protein [Syntrophales bacterium]
MRFESRKRIIMTVVTVFQLCLLIAMTPLQAETTPEPETIIKEQKSSAVVEEPEGIEGKAYYYAKRYNKKRTSSGARYNPRKLTAAHPTLPLGTKLKVVNLTNDRSVVVTVNDRCRKHSFEFIDLSQAAARQLGFLGKGMARVRIIPIEE